MQPLQQMVVFVGKDLNINIRLTQDDEYNDSMANFTT